MIEVVVTTAGRQAIIDATQAGTNAVKITQMGVGSGRYTPTASQTALQSEIKRLPIVEGGRPGDNTIHVAYQDDSESAYSVYELGLYLEDGTLFAVYSSNTLILQKTQSSTAILAVDIALEDISVTNISFGDVTFGTAAATTTNAGVIEIATDAEVQAGEATQLALTPANIKALTATANRAGIVKLASAAQTIAATSASVATTPAGVKAAFDDRLADDATTISGTSTEKVVTPAGLSARTATTARKGIIELATEAEAKAGTDSSRAITPATLKATIEDNVKNASETVKGIVELATEAEAVEGTDSSKAVTPAGVEAAITQFNGSINNAKVTATGSTTARTLADRFADGITPKDFGANGNGSTNDTAAFTALEAAVTGRMVDLEGLTYLVNARPTGNDYYNGYFKVSAANLPPVGVDIRGSRIVNAEGNGNPSFYPSGRNRIYQASRDTNQMAMARFSDDDAGNSLVFLKSRSGTVNRSRSAVAGDIIAWLSFLVDNGNVDYENGITQGARAGTIAGYVSENSSLNDSGTTATGVKGVIRITANIDGGTVSGKGIEVMNDTCRPTDDNHVNLGSAGRRWKSVYSVTGTINTSDERMKSDITPIPDAVLNAWGNVNFKSFKFSEDVARDASSAITYSGVIAQEIIQAFNAAGLNALDYGVVTLEELDDGSTLYGVRYTEVMVLEAAYQRRLLLNVLSRLDALEGGN